MSTQAPQVSEALKPGTSESFYGPTIILFILMALLCGGLLKQLNKKFGIPYSPMLLLLGLILGTYHSSLGEWGRASALIEMIHPHTGIQIFVPTLMFTGALGANFYLFRKSIVNIIILAVPGVIIGSLLFAFVLRSILGYTDADMTWYQALTLGCALSSTDPVAVVTLLKELGSSGRFNTLIEGESLISGAVSMILYYLFLDVANGQTTSTVEFTWNAIRLTLGGCIVGLLFGVVVSIWMKRIIRDHTLSIVITIIGSYLSFYLCEFTWLKFGGVAAVVIQGLYLAAVVKRKIYPESEQALDTVWGTMAFGGMTVLFVLAGVIAGVEFSHDHTLTTEDWVKMFAFWALMIVVRAIVIYGFYPILKSRGYGLTKKELLVLIYGGLKGGLGLSLAMMITVDPYYPTRFRQLATFYMGGMVLLTVLINGLTSKKILEYIEMIHIPEIKIKLFKKCVKEVLKQTASKYEQLKHEPDLAYAKWKDVEGIADIHKLGEVERVREEGAKEIQMRDSLMDMKESELTEEIRFRFTRYLHKTYWSFYGEGQLSEEGIKILSENCDVANDNAQQKLSYFQQLTDTFALDTIQLYTRFKDWALIGPFFTRMIVSKIYFVYEVAVIFTESCQQTIRVFRNDFPINNEQLKEVIDEVKENVDQAIAYINQLESNFPDVITAVHTRRAATIVLKNKKNSLRKMYEEGFIDDLQYQALRKEIDVNLVNIHFAPLKLEELRVNEVLIDCPLFSTLSKPDIARIKSKAVQRTFQKDSTIVSANGQLNYAYILLSGSVREQFEDFYLIKSTGSVINPYNFTQKKDSQCSVTALNNVKVMEVRPEVIDDLIASNPEFKKKWFKALFIYESHLNKNLQFLHKTLSDKQFRRFVEAAEIRLLKSGEKDFVQFGAYLVDGQLDCEGSTYTQGGSIIPKEKMIKALTDCIVIKFNEVTGINVKETLRVSNLKEDDKKSG